MVTKQSEQYVIMTMIRILRTMTRIRIRKNNKVDNNMDTNNNENKHTY